MGSLLYSIFYNLDICMSQFLTQSPAEFCCLSSSSLEKFQRSDDKLQNSKPKSKSELLANAMSMLSDIKVNICKKVLRIKTFFITRLTPLFVNRPGI